jgi:dihydrofolate reductase
LKLIIIAAIAKNNVIGRLNGEMPWHVKEEFQHFKETTLGSAIIMGRKTFETLGKPLKGRENIIVTRNKIFEVEFKDVKIFHSLEESIRYCKFKNYENVFIIGGGNIYKQAIPLVDEMILSFMKFEAEGEVKFPEIQSHIWKKVSNEDREQFEIIRYVRKDGQTN